MRLGELLAPFLSAPLSEVQSAREIGSLTRTGQYAPDDALWLATQGEQQHGLNYYTDACQAAIVYEPPYANPPVGAIALENLRQQLGSIAARFYGYPSKQLKIKAITGTDGKSSLVHLLAQASNAAMIGTIGYGRLCALQAASHTTPDALVLQAILADFVAEGIEEVAMEVSSHALRQGRINGLEIDTAIFSNLSRDHLDYHHDMEDYFLAKALLFSRALRYAIINIDDAYGRRLLLENRIYEAAQCVVVSSQGSDFLADAHRIWRVSAKEIVANAKGLAFELCVVRDGKREVARLQTRLLARFNVDNLLNVAACLVCDGYALSEIVAILARLEGVAGRVEPITLENGALALIDYAHTPAALENALCGVRAHVAGKLWVICGCGGNRDAGKRPLMAQAASRFADFCVFTDDNPREEAPEVILQQMLDGVEDKTKVEVIRPRAEAITQVLARLKPDDAVLIAGKGHEAYQIIGKVQYPYSDKAVVRAWQQAQSEGR